MIDIVEDVSKLTLIPRTSLDCLIEKANYSICHSIEESQIENKTITEVNIGVGKISIFVDNETIKYRFEPSRSLEDSIKETVTSKKSPLVNKVEESLVDRITNVYKDLLWVRIYQIRKTL